MFHVKRQLERRGRPGKLARLAGRDTSAFRPDPLDGAWWSGSNKALDREPAVGVIRRTAARWVMLLPQRTMPRSRLAMPGGAHRRRPKLRPTSRRRVDRHSQANRRHDASTDSIERKCPSHTSSRGTGPGSDLHPRSLRARRGPHRKRKPPAQRPSTSPFHCEAPAPVHAGAPCVGACRCTVSAAGSPCSSMPPAVQGGGPRRNTSVDATSGLHGDPRAGASSVAAGEGARSASEQHFRLSDRAQRRSLPRTVRVLRTLESRRTGMRPVPLARH
jgi:hypothetical protein